jgi:hypothetical protein
MLPAIILIAALAIRLRVGTAALPVVGGFMYCSWKRNRKEIEQ